MKSNIRGSERLMSQSAGELSVLQSRLTERGDSSIKTRKRKRGRSIAHYEQCRFFVVSRGLMMNLGERKRKRESNGRYYSRLRSWTILLTIKIRKK